MTHVELDGRRMSGTVPVSFALTSDGRRAVVFGPHVHNACRIRVNGVDLSIGSLTFVEQDDRTWRYRDGGVRRWDTIGGAPDGGRRAVIEWCARRAPGLAETVAVWPLGGIRARPDRTDQVERLRAALDVAERFAGFESDYHDTTFTVRPTGDVAFVSADLPEGVGVPYVHRYPVVGRLFDRGEHVGFLIDADRGSAFHGPTPIPYDLVRAEYSHHMT